MNLASPERIEIQVLTRSELDGALNHAIEMLKPAAARKRVGIKVTRKDVGLYSAALCEAAPYGTTHENWN